MIYKTYADFLNSVRKNDVGDFLKSKTIQQYINSFCTDFFPTRYGRIPICYIRDNTTGKYIRFDKSIKYICGYNNLYFLDGGADFVYSLYDKRYYKVFATDILLKKLIFLENIPTPENHLFQSNYGIFDVKGNYRNLLEETRVIYASENREPLVTFGMIYDITDKSNKNLVIQRAYNLSASSKLELSNTYSLIHPVFEKLSGRENEILKYISEGFTNEEIATKLFLSISTVKFHKKNISRKTALENERDFFNLNSI